MHKVASNNSTTYILGDFNENLRLLGYIITKNLGKSLEWLINQGILNYLGLNVPILFGRNSSIMQDIMLTNRKVRDSTLISQGQITTSYHIIFIL